MRSRFWQGLFVLIVAGAIILSALQTASACSCGPPPTVLDSFDEADEVVILRVISVEKVIPVHNEEKLTPGSSVEGPDGKFYVAGVRTATMIVERVFKGKLKIRDEIVFGQGGGADCLWTFNEESVGDQFLFYLTRPEKFSDRRFLPSPEPGLWFAFGCGRSSGLAGATDDLLYLENMSKRRGKTRISGSIGGWRNPDMDVEGKRIKIIGSKKTYVTKTNKEGVFEIYDLPPGKYFVEPETPAGWKIDPSWLRYSPSVIGNNYGQPELRTPNQVAIILEPKKHAGVDITFTEDNSVRGRVIGPKGKPMSRVCVYLVRPGQEEKWGPSDCTDEQGRFHISAIPAGEYVLVSNRDGKPSDREPFGRIFYPGVSERERAAVINIAPGDTIDNIDLVIPKLEQTIIIEGVLRYSDGKPVVDEWVKFKITESGENVDGDVSEQTDGAGRFTLRVLKGLTGELSAEDWLATGLYKNCPKVDELLAKSGSNNVTVQSNIIKLTTDQNVYAVELTLPFPLCEKVEK